MSNEDGLLFDLRSTDGMDLFARMIAMFQAHAVEFKVTRNGQWATIEV